MKWIEEDGWDGRRSWLLRSNDLGYEPNRAAIEEFLHGRFRVEIWKDGDWRLEEECFTDLDSAKMEAERLAMLELL